MTHTKKLRDKVVNPALTEGVGVYRGRLGDHFLCCSRHWQIGYVWRKQASRN